MSRSAAAAPALLPTLPPMPPCSKCGLTVEQLRETGLLGCAHCYRAFAPLVAYAVDVLHGGGESVATGTNTAPGSPPPPVELPPDRGALPWPTKRAASR